MKRRRLSQDEMVTDSESRKSSSGNTPVSAQDFLESYARGDFAANSIPLQPREFVHQLDASRTEGPDPSGRAALAAGEISEVPTSEQITESYIRFYRSNGFIPAPLSQSEINRSRTLEHDFLVTSGQKEAVDRIVKLCRTFFHSDAAFVIVMHGDQAYVLSADASDMPGLASGNSFAARYSVCAHSMLSQTDRVFEVPDLQADWRFAGNQVLSDFNLRSYGASAGQGMGLRLTRAAGFPIRLRRAGARKDAAPRECVGNLCISSTTPHETLSDEQLGVLKSMAEMISHELEADADARHREVQAARHDYVARLITAVLVRTERSDSPTLQQCLERASADLKTMLNADAVVMVDLRKLATPSINLSPTSASDETSALAVLGGSEADGALALALASRESRAAIQDLLKLHASTQQTSFDFSTAPSPLAAVLPPGTQSSLAIPLTSPDGTPVLLVLATSNTLLRRFDSSDVAFAQAVGAVCLARILHERVHEEQAKQSHIAQLISHEVRTPIHVIVNQLELIRDVCTPGPAKLSDIVSMLDTARSCAVSLREVLEDTLAYSHLSNVDMLELDTKGRETVQTDIAQLVQETVDVAVDRCKQHDAAGRARATAVDVAVVVEEDVLGYEATVDASGLRCVLRNVVLNAIQYTTAGQVSVTLEAPKGSSVSIVVADTGIGMSDDFVRDRKLFEPFVQADSFSPGAGLGLAICESLLEKMKGDISVQSTLGQGTIVRITVPVEHVGFAQLMRSPSLSSSKSTNSIHSTPLKRILSLPATVASPPRTSGSPASAADDLTAVGAGVPTEASLELSWEQQPLRVLVADDNSTARRILTTLLARKGVDYREVEDGQKAVALYKEWRPHVFWTDISMPVLDGLQAAAQIRGYEAAHALPACRIVAVSAARELDSQYLRSASLDEYHIKGANVLPSLSKGLDQLKATRRSTAVEQVIA